MILGGGTLLGLMGGMLLFVPVALNPAALQVTVVHHAIRYAYADSPAGNFAPEVVWHIFYVAIISLPLFLLQDKRLVGFSTALVVSAVFSHIYYLYAFESLWCLLSAILSLYLGNLFRTWAPDS
jgi:hypothetical protein